MCHLLHHVLNLKEKLEAACLTIPSIVVLVWAVLVYTFGSVDRFDIFVEVSRFIYEGLGLLGLAIATLVYGFLRAKDDPPRTCTSWIAVFCCRLIPFYGLLAWATLTYLYLEAKTHHSFVNISRVLFEAVFLGAVVTANLAFICFINHAD